MNFKKITLVISLILAALFISASGFEMWTYMQSKIGFKFFPFLKDFHKVLFWILIIFQILLAGLLILPRFRLLGLYGTFLVLSSISTYLYLMLHYAEYIPCACSGLISTLSWEGHLWFTIIFTVLTGFNIVFLPNKDIHARG